MNTETDVIEDILFLARSVTRIQILETLQEAGRIEKDELRNRFNCDRTTLGRNLNELEEYGWIQNGTGDCSITPTGEMVIEAFNNLGDVVGVARNLNEFLRWVPMEELDLDLQLLADAEILLPEPGDPYAMINRQVQLIYEMDRTYGFLRVTGLHATEAGHEAIVHNGASGELVVTPDIADTWHSKPSYAALMAEMFETGRFHVSVYNGELPYSLVVIDDTVQITVDEAGEPRALLETQSDDVRAWAEQMYEDYRQQAESLTESHFVTDQDSRDQPARRAN